MKSRPLLMNSAMVNATLRAKDTKKQTRRIADLNSTGRYRLDEDGWVRSFVGDITGQSESEEGAWMLVQDGFDKGYRCPYGRAGDHLWVRETWRTGISFDSLSPKVMAARCIKAGYPLALVPLRYESDDAIVNGDVLDKFGSVWGKKRVSIHLPRWASRITLVIAQVRLERLHDISDADAISEGVDPAKVEAYLQAGADRPAAHAFRDLWESLNGRDSWGLNPLVWAIDFNRVDT